MIATDPIDRRRDLHHAPPWVERYAAAVLVAGLFLFFATAAIWILAYSHQVDLSIYRFDGESLLHRAPLYDVGLGGKPNELLFNYPPFAALVFTPLAAFPLPLLRLLVPIGNITLLAFVIRRCWQVMGIRGRSELRSLTMIGVGLLVWLEPVHTTIALGQIGLVLLAVLVFDLLPIAGERRGSGIGVGLAAGIKLTPLFFIPFLLLTGRARAARVAAATFVSTIAVGFLVAPSQAVTYWFGGRFHDLTRTAVGPASSTGNDSLWGALARAGLSGRALTATWWIAVVLVSAICLALAQRAHRRDEGLLAVALCGLGSAAVSPYSWGYQWVWFVPLAIFLAYRAIILHSFISWSLLTGLWIATAAWITEWRDPASGETPPDGLISLHPGGLLEASIHSVYLVAFVSAMVLSARYAGGEEPRHWTVSRAEPKGQRRLLATSASARGQSS